MEYTKADEWENLIGGFFETENLGPTINILEYLPKDIAFMVMKKLPPKDLLALCFVKNKRIKELCTNFMYNRDYQRIWGEATEILALNIARQSKEIAEMMLIKLPPPMLVSMCQLKHKKLRERCKNAQFIERYKKLWDEELSDDDHPLYSYDLEYLEGYMELFGVQDIYLRDGEAFDELLRYYVENFRHEDVKKVVEIYMKVFGSKTTYGEIEWRLQNLIASFSHRRNPNLKYEDVIKTFKVLISYLPKESLKIVYEEIDASYDEEDTNHFRKKYYEAFKKEIHKRE